MGGACRSSSTAERCTKPLPISPVAALRLWPLPAKRLAVARATIRNITTPRRTQWATSPSKLGPNTKTATSDSTLGRGDERKQYEISGDALLQAFEAEDGSGPSLLDAFEKGKDKIMAAVQAASGTPTTDGIIVLGSGDFEPKNDRGGISPGEGTNPLL